MLATDKHIEMMATLIVRLWPDNTRDDAIEIIQEYLFGEDTGAFIHYAEDQCVGVALCSIRHDYVEGCKSSPVGYLEGVVVDEKYRKKRKGAAKMETLQRKQKTQCSMPKL